MDDSERGRPRCRGTGPRVSRVDPSTKRGRGYFGYSTTPEKLLLKERNNKKKKCRGGSEQEAEYDEVSHGVPHEEKLLNDEADTKPDNNQGRHRSAAAVKVGLKPAAEVQARNSDVAEPPRGKSPLSRSSSICSSRGRSRQANQGSESLSESPSYDSSRANSDDDDTDDEDKSPGNASGANVSFPVFGQHIGLPADFLKKSVVADSAPSYSAQASTRHSSAPATPRSDYSRSYQPSVSPTRTPIKDEEEEEATESRRKRKRSVSSSPRCQPNTQKRRTSAVADELGPGKAPAGVPLRGSDSAPPPDQPVKGEPLRREDGTPTPIAPQPRRGVQGEHLKREDGTPTPIAPQPTPERPQQQHSDFPLMTPKPKWGSKPTPPSTSYYRQYANESTIIRIDEIPVLIIDW